MSKIAKHYIFGLLMMLFFFILPIIYHSREIYLSYLILPIIQEFSETKLGFFLITISFGFFLFFISFFIINKSDKSLKTYLETDTKLVSDNIFIIFYLITWIFYGLPLMLFSEPNDIIRDYFNDYLYFSIISVGILSLLKVNQHYKSNESKGFKHLGNWKNYMDIIFISNLIFIIIFLLSFFIPQNAIFTEEGFELFSFMAFASIPVEEIVFRGICMDIFYLISLEIINDIKRLSLKNKKFSNDLIQKNENISWIISIFITSLIFAYYHIHRYGYNTWTSMFLILLAFGLGIARKYVGLSSCYLIHLFNNLICLGNA